MRSRSPSAWASSRSVTSRIAADTSTPSSVSSALEADVGGELAAVLAPARELRPRTHVARRRIGEVPVAMVRDGPSSAGPARAARRAGRSAPSRVVAEQPFGLRVHERDRGRRPRRTPSRRAPPRAARGTCASARRRSLTSRTTAATSLPCTRSLNARRARSRPGTRCRRGGDRELDARHPSGGSGGCRPNRSAMRAWHGLRGVGNEHARPTPDQLGAAVTEEPLGLRVREDDACRGRRRR